MFLKKSPEANRKIAAMNARQPASRRPRNSRPRKRSAPSSRSVEGIRSTSGGGPQEGRSGSSREKDSRGRRRSQRPSVRRVNGQRERRRFETRRSIVIPGSKGTYQISLRMLTIALFALLAFIVVMPTFTRYLDKQQELREAKARLSSVQEHTAELERELKLWKDDEYVKTQARQRLGYVMPGQTLYIVTDPSKGTAKERLEKKVESVNKKRRAATPWYTTMWDSVKVAGQSGKVDNVDDVPIVGGKNGNGGNGKSR